MLSHTKLLVCPSVARFLQFSMRDDGQDIRHVILDPVPKRDVPVPPTVYIKYSHMA